MACWSQVGFQGSPDGQPDYLASVDTGGAFRWIYSGGLGSCGGIPLCIAGAVIDGEGVSELLVDFEDLEEEHTGITGDG